MCAGVLGRRTCEWLRSSVLELMRRSRSHKEAMFKAASAFGGGESGNEQSRMQRMPVGL